MRIEFKSIGIIQTPFNDTKGMPIQPSGAKGRKGTVEIFSEYEDGLKDLDGFSHIILLYYFHMSKGFKLHVVPFLDSELRGIFSTRAPKRPNPIGLSIVKLIKIEGKKIYIENVDILDKTPLLDIKPYIPEFEEREEVCTGWFKKTKKIVSEKKSDERFK